MENKIKNLENLLIENGFDNFILIDESHKHSNHYFAEKEEIFPSHISATIISDIFKDKNTLMRQKSINKILSPAFKNGLHAFSMKLYTNEEFKNKH